MKLSTLVIVLCVFTLVSISHCQQADRIDLLIAKIKSLEDSFSRVPSSLVFPTPINLEVKQNLSYCVDSPFGKPTMAIVGVYLRGAWNYIKNSQHNDARVYYEFRAAGNPMVQVKAVLSIGWTDLAQQVIQVMVPLNEKGCFEYRQMNDGPMLNTVTEIQLLGYQYILKEFLTSTSIPIPEQFALNFTIHNRFNASNQMGYGYALKSNEGNGNWNVTCGYFFNGQYYVYSNGKLILDQDVFNSTINIIQRRSLEYVSNATSIGICIDKFLILPDDALKAAISSSKSIEKYQLTVTDSFIQQCSDETMWELTIVDLHFIICLTSDSQWLVIGEDYVIKADSLLNYNETKARLILGQIPNVQECEISAYPSLVAPVVKWYFEKYPTMEKRRCIFLHGVGEELNIGILDSFPEYWGNVKENVGDLCTEVKFLRRADTKLKGWTDHGLQQKPSNSSVNPKNSSRISLSKVQKASMEQVVIYFLGILWLLYLKYIGSCG